MHTPTSINLKSYIIYYFVSFHVALAVDECGYTMLNFAVMSLKLS
jgi:hypothetical protein